VKRICGAIGLLLVLVTSWACLPGERPATDTIVNYLDAVRQADLDRLYCLSTGASHPAELGDSAEERRARFEAWFRAQEQLYLDGRDAAADPCRDWDAGRSGSAAARPAATGCAARTWPSVPWAGTASPPRPRSAGWGGTARAGVASPPPVSSPLERSARWWRRSRPSSPRRRRADSPCPPRSSRFRRLRAGARVGPRPPGASRDPSG